VILDEPTASLDAQAEADLFGRIRELFAPHRPVHLAPVRERPHR
jgi:ABC-type sugar transport system ATPase subunit